MNLAIYNIFGKTEEQDLYFNSATFEFPVWLVVGLALTALTYIAYKYFSRGKIDSNTLDKCKPFEKLKNHSKFMEENPDFSYQYFLKNVGILFEDLYKSILKNDLSGVEGRLSYGMSHKAQNKIKTIKLLNLRSYIERISVKSADICNIYDDEDFWQITVGLRIDYNKNNIKGLNTENKLFSGVFNEYWTFLKRKETDKLVICPKCFTKISQGADNDICGSCGINLSDFNSNWHLYDIKQSDDFLINSNAKFKTENLEEKLDDLYKRYDDFNLQLIKDKAAGVYLLIQEAVYSGNFNMISPFVSDSFLKKFKDLRRDDKTKQINLDINGITLIGVREQSDRYILILAIKNTFQRLYIDEGRIEKIDISPRVATEIIFMERNKEYLLPIGSVSFGFCPSCGKSANSEESNECPHCGLKFNDIRYGWIFSEIMDMGKYNSYFMRNIGDFQYKIDPKLLDSVFSVKDYAINNIMIMIAVDGEFAEKEKEFVEYISKKWKYNTDKIYPLFDMAVAGKLVIRMPDDMQKRKDIYELMEKAAKFDGALEEDERNLLAQVKKEYLVKDY